MNIDHDSDHILVRAKIRKRIIIKDTKLGGAGKAYNIEGLTEPKSKKNTGIKSEDALHKYSNEMMKKFGRNKNSNASDSSRSVRTKEKRTEQGLV